MYEHLKRRAGMLATVVALTAVILAVPPGAVDAQDDAQEMQQEGAHEGPTSNLRRAPQAPTNQVVNQVVVAPGESLWAIAQGHLGPDAPPQQVANEVERIFELNRDRIGDNPDLILAGQELSLASVSEPSGRAVAETEPVVVVEAGPPVVAAPAEKQPAAEEQLAAEEQPAAAGRDVVEQTPEELKRLPEASPEKQEEASAGAEGSLPESDNTQRRVLGLGVLALTLLLALLMALRVPMRRKARNVVGEPYAGYYANYAQPHHPEQQEEQWQTAEIVAAQQAQRGAPESETEPAPQGPAAAAAPARDISRRRRLRAVQTARRQRRPRKGRYAER